MDIACYCVTRYILHFPIQFFLEKMFCEYNEYEMYEYSCAKLCKTYCGSEFTPDILFAYTRKLEIKL